MTGHLHLRLHVNEPWNFAGQAGSDELAGWTIDHIDADAEEWELELDEGFDFGGHHYRHLLVSPRYVGERLERVMEAVIGFPVRIAHRDGEGGWHFAFAGMLSIPRDENEEETI